MNDEYISYLDTPFFTLKITADKEAVIGVCPCENRKKANENNISIQATQELKKYFLGELKAFSVKTKSIGTQKEKAVLEELKKVPYGETISYKTLGERALGKNASRFVGNVMHKNRILIMYPCHRVIGGDGSLGGFALGKNIKKALLEFESVHKELFVV